MNTGFQKFVEVIEQMPPKRWSRLELGHRTASQTCLYLYAQEQCEGSRADALKAYGFRGYERYDALGNVFQINDESDSYEEAVRRVKEYLASLPDQPEILA
jgi:hypothetical protein